MNIGINATYLEGRRRGVARYLLNLLNNWSVEFPENRYYLYFRDEIPSDKFLKRDCFVNKVLKAPLFLNRWIFWENIFLIFQLLKDKELDIFFSPSYTLPFYTPCRKKVITIFDIYYTVHPEWTPLRNRYILGFLSKQAARKADIVLTASQFDKDDIVKFYDVPEDKVKVIYLAAEDKFKPIDNPTDAKKLPSKYGIKKRFILCVGIILNRRLQDVIIRAFYKLHQVYRDISLVIVGQNRTCPYIDIRKVIEECNLKGSVVWVHYLPEEELPLIYNAASAFIYLSLYEGESIPLKEAMACGIPVITSPILEEVVGDAGYIVKDPLDENQVKEAMEKTLFDENLRTRMIPKGLERSKLFSWKRCAKCTIEIFEQILVRDSIK